jgi:hypothetical protein
MHDGAVVLGRGRRRLPDATAGAWLIRRLRDVDVPLIATA